MRHYHAAEAIAPLRCWSSTANTVVPDISLPAADVRLDNLIILVIDDQQDSREMVAALLERRGAEVLQSNCGEAALTVLQQRPVHLLIADIAMPRMDGYDLMRRIRSAGDQTPAIAVTAFARSDDRRHALECGYTAYLAKPIDGAELARTARELVDAPHRGVSQPPALTDAV